VTTVQLDEAGRVESVVMENDSQRMEVSYSYYATGLVEYATYGNGTRTFYDYYENQRLKQIRHEYADESGYLKDLSYEYYENGWLQRITETTPSEPRASARADDWYVTEFTYDNRGRLIHEFRDQGRGLRSEGFVYDLSYTYDQLGNRKTKVNHLTGETTKYTYDIEDRELYWSNSNRLMYYWTENAGQEIIEEVWYYYNNDGNVTRIVRHMTGDDRYRAPRFVYNGAGMVEYVTGETWSAIDELDWIEDGSGSEYALTNTEMTWAEARVALQS